VLAGGVLERVLRALLWLSGPRLHVHLHPIRRWAEARRAPQRGGTN
jgi:hypothetical protein